MQGTKAHQPRSAGNTVRLSGTFRNVAQKEGPVKDITGPVKPRLWDGAPSKQETLYASRAPFAMWRKKKAR